MTGCKEELRYHGGDIDLRTDLLRDRVFKPVSFYSGCSTDESLGGH